MKRTFGNLKYCVSVENGLDINLKKVRDEIKKIYNEKSWGVDFEEVVNDNECDFRIIITTPKTIVKKCPGIENEHNLSCADRGPAKSIYLNSERWKYGGDFESSIAAYRKYLVLHETGHILGLDHHECVCDDKNKCLAPVMMQQTYKLGECQFNPEPLDWEVELLNF